VRDRPGQYVVHVDHDGPATPDDRRRTLEPFFSTRHQRQQPRLPDQQRDHHPSRRSAGSRRLAPGRRAGVGHPAPSPPGARGGGRGGRSAGSAADPAPPLRAAPSTAGSLLQRRPGSGVSAYSFSRYWIFRTLIPSTSAARTVEPSTSSRVRKIASRSISLSVAPGISPSAFGAGGGRGWWPGDHRRSAARCGSAPPPARSHCPARARCPASRRPTGR